MRGSSSCSAQFGTKHPILLLHARPCTPSLALASPWLPSEECQCASVSGDRPPPGDSPVTATAAGPGEVKPPHKATPSQGICNAHVPATLGLSHLSIVTLFLCRGSRADLCPPGWGLAQVFGAARHLNMAPALQDWETEVTCPFWTVQ